MAKTLAESSKERGIALRILGAVGIILHCPKYSVLLETMQRNLTDVDMIAYARQEKQLLGFLRQLNYEFETYKELISVGMESNRRIFRNPGNGIKVDVFFDRLEFCHTIDLRKRLEVDFPTIAVSDLLLEKTQIVEINEKDIMDSTVLLREHDLGNTDSDSVNVRYLTQLMSDDWGLYYTVTTNLKKIQARLARYTGLSQDDADDVKQKIDRLLLEIETVPKSLKWNMRAKVGTKKIWYQQVEEIESEEPMFKF
jgi:hypothetical protein